MLLCANVFVSAMWKLQSRAYDVRDELTVRGGAPTPARTWLINETNCDSLPEENEPPEGAVVVVVGATVVVVVGATVVVVVGATVVVVVWATVVVVVVGATVVVVGALVVVVVGGAVVVVVGASVVVVGKRVVTGSQSGIVLGTAVEVLGDAESTGVRRVSPELALVVVERSGLAAGSSLVGSGPSWPVIANAAPPITTNARTIARTVAVRVLTARYLRGAALRGLSSLSVFFLTGRHPENVVNPTLRGTRAGRIRLLSHDTHRASARHDCRGGNRRRRPVRGRRWW